MHWKAPIHDDFIKECRAAVIDPGKLTKICQITLVGSKVKDKIHSPKGFFKVVPVTHIPQDEFYVTGDIIWPFFLRVHRWFETIKDAN